MAAAALLAVAATGELCRQIENVPARRRAVREDFYQRFGDADNDGLSYGDSELAFLDWEIQSGVLDPVTGSAWHAWAATASRSASSER